MLRSTVAGSNENPFASSDTDSRVFRGSTSPRSEQIIGCTSEQIIGQTLARGLCGLALSSRKGRIIRRPLEIPATALAGHARFGRSLALAQTARQGDARSRSLFSKNHSCRALCLARLKNFQVPRCMSLIINALKLAWPAEALQPPRFFGCTRVHKPA
jgi:hypothetical protein